MINVIIKFDILIFSRILCGNNFVIPFSLLQIYIYSKRLSNRVEKQNRVPSFKKEHLRKCGGGVCRLTGVRWNSPVHHRYGKSRNRYCLSARRLNRNFRLFIATHARTRTHRVVSNDLTSEVGGRRRRGELLLERARNWQWFCPWRAYEKREERKVKRLPARRGEATPEVISCRLFTSRPSILLCKYYYWPSRTPFQWKIDARNLVLRWKEKKKIK